MSFMDGLSAGITGATDVASGYEGGQVKAQQLIAQRLMQQREMEHKNILEKLMAGRLDVSQQNANTNKTFKLNGIDYKTDNDGNLLALPKVGGGSTNAQPTEANPTTSVTALADAGLPGAGSSAAVGAPSASSPPVGPGPSRVGPGASVVPGVKMATKADPVSTAIAIANATKGIPTYADLHPKETDRYTAVPGVDPDTGKPTVYTMNSRTGEMKSSGVGKPVAAGNAQTAPQMAAARANMESAMKTMDDYEAKLRVHPEIYGPTEATLGALSSSPTAMTAQHPWDIPMSYGANKASQHLQASNPELARYLTAKKFVAEAVLNTHKRPNQTQYEIEQELGGVGPVPSNMQIDMVAARRNRMYQEVFANPNAGGTAPASAPHTKPSLTQDQYNAGLAKGHTPAEIAQHYDLSQVKQ